MKTKEGKQPEFERWWAINSDPYSRAAAQFAVTWAELMEKGMTVQLGDKEFSSLAAESSIAADTEGVTGAMYGAAVGALAHLWEHGDRLRRWHNARYGVLEEQAKGGVVDPCMVTIG